MVNLFKPKIVKEQKPKMAKKEEIKEVVKVVAPKAVSLTSRQMWDLAVKERVETPQWGCENKKVPVYKYKVTVKLNEEPEFDDNVFNVLEPLNVSVGVDDNADKKDSIQGVSGVGVTFIQPDGVLVYKLTNENGVIDFAPHLRGGWQFIVDDVGIAPKFKVV
jgi:hypothetical protein